MKKAFRVMFVVLAVMVVLGVAGYFLLTNVVSDKAADLIQEELEADGRKEQIKSMAESDPELMAFVQEGARANGSDLPFTTVEGAARVIIDKVGVTELLNLKGKVDSRTITKDEVLGIMEAKLTDDEIRALQYVAYHELYQ
ncbi:MAG: hypothetical protein ACI4XL_10665 [Bacillus sp. (in: firmicutes)]